MTLRGFWKEGRAALALTLALSFLLGLYAPLELYFTNKSEFHFDALTLLPVLAALFVLLALVGGMVFTLCRLISRRLYDGALTLAMVAYLCTYVQGMFLVGKLPPLDGTAIDWSAYTGQNVISVVLWMIVAAVMILLAKRLKRENLHRLFTGLSLFFSAILLVTVVTVCIQTDGFRPKAEVGVTKQEEFTLSSQENFIILVVDALDSGTFQDLMDSDDPEFADIFADFTYYPNTVCAYPLTKPSIPFILTGQWFENTEPFADYATKAMDASQLLQTLRAQEYRMGIYEEELTYDSDNIFGFENVQGLQYRFSSGKQMLWAQVKLVWFKYAPFPLKRAVHIDVDAINRLTVADSGEELFTADNVDFYEDVQNQEIVTTGDKCFRFIHIEGAHVPYRYNAQVQRIDSDQGSYQQNVECSMTIVAAYLQKLKDAGIYDNSAILVMADHGYDPDPVEPVVGRMNPFLAVKGLDEHHDLEISQAPISYEDLQTAYARLLEGKSSGQVFDAQEGDDRVRRCILYKYLEDDHMLEYTQQGDAADPSGLTPTGTVYDANPTGNEDSQ
jgi:hypothetical protein